MLVIALLVQLKLRLNVDAEILPNVKFVVWQNLSLVKSFVMYFVLVGDIDVIQNVVLHLDRVKILKVFIFVD